MAQFTLSRRAFVRWAARGSLLGAFGYPILIEPNWAVLERVAVPIASLPAGLEGLKIGLLADFHLGRYVTRRDVLRAVGLIARERPDLVVLAGDFADGKPANIDTCAEVLATLNARHGVYACLGNHDYWTNAKRVRSSLETAGIRVLVNESVKMVHRGEKFALVGLDDAWEGMPHIEKSLATIPLQTLKIVAVHEPDYADDLARVPGWIPLQLSGHSHGGQVQLPFGGPFFLPPKAKKYPQGLQPVAGTNRQVYTTRGVGHTVPVRFNCRPEATLLNLQRAEVRSQRIEGRKASVVHCPWWGGVTKKPGQHLTTSSRTTDLGIRPPRDRVSRSNLSRHMYTAG